MIKITNRLKNYSKKTICLYGIFRLLSEEEIAELGQEIEASLPKNLDPAMADFARTHALISVVTNREEFEEFATCYYVQKNWDHFVLWCEHHGFEDVEKSTEVASEAASVYIDNCADPDDITNELTAVCWVYKATDVARVLRMFFSCAPVGASYEGEMENNQEFNFYTQNIGLAVKDCLRSCSIEQLMQLIENSCAQEVIDQIKSRSEPTAEPQDTELSAQRPKTEGQKKKRRHSKKVTSNQKGESK